MYDTGAPGDWILHHTYDALGRLIRAQRPIPAGGGSGGQVYTEHYYYDGVRRVQEVHNNPVFPVPPGNDEGSMEEETSPSTTNVTWVDREYVHTPGYVDEFVCETDRYDYPWYHLQDANFNVVGLVHETGVVVRQYTLDPYGRVIRSDQFAAHPVSRLGHQGLFFDRLDAGVTTAGLLPEHLGVTAGGTGNTDIPWMGAYQNRNRTYLPHYGRFAQGDPNGTGGAIFDDLSFNGQVLPPTLGAAGPVVFSDGLHRHIAYGSQPLANSDPTGLFSLGGMMSGMGTMAGMAANFVLPGPGNFITGMYGSLMATYSAGLSWDVDWALDWDMPDDMHTRTDDSWVAMALGQGLYDAFRIEVPFTDIGFNPLDLARKQREMGLGPTHGDPIKHFGPMVHIFNMFKNKPGVSGLTTDMAVRGPGGQILRGPDGSTLRPDVQFWRDGRLYVFEVVNTNFDPFKQDKYEAILRHNGIPTNVLQYSDR